MLNETQSTDTPTGSTANLINQSDSQLEMSDSALDDKSLDVLKVSNEFEAKDELDF